MPDHEEPIGTHVLVKGTAYRRSQRILKRLEQGWTRLSVPPNAKPGKLSLLKSWYAVGRLPTPYEVINEATALELQKSSVEAWAQKLRDAAALADVGRPVQRSEATK